MEGMHIIQELLWYLLLKL